MGGRKRARHVRSGQSDRFICLSTSSNMVRPATTSNTRSKRQHKAAAARRFIVVLDRNRQKIESETKIYAL